MTAAVTTPDTDLGLFPRSPTLTLVITIIDIITDDVVPRRCNLLATQLVSLHRSFSACRPRHRILTVTHVNVLVKQVQSIHHIMILLVTVMVIKNSNTCETRLIDEV